MNLKQLTLLALVFTTLLLHSCKEKETTAPSESGYAFNLSIDDEKTLTWESINASNFRRYIIVRSLDSIPDDPLPPNFSQSTVRFFVEDQETTTFTDFDFPVLGDRHYKVYIELEDRFVLSPTVTVESFSKGLPFCYSHAGIIPGTNHMVFIAQGGDVYKYDFVTNEILLVRSLNLDNGTIRIGDAGNGIEIFAFGGFSTRLLILDPDDLSTREDKAFNNPIYDVTPSDKGFFFVALDKSFEGNLFSLRRSDLSIVSEAAEQSGFVERKLAILESDPNKLYEMSSSKISVHDFDNNGIITSSVTSNVSANAGLKKDISLSTDGNSFIHSRSTKIYSAETLSTIEEYPYISYYHTFDQSNPDFLYFSDFESTFRIDLSNNNITLVFAGLDVSQVFDIEAKLLLVGNSFSGGSNCTYVTTINK